MIESFFELHAKCNFYFFVSFQLFVLVVQLSFGVDLLSHFFFEFGDPFFQLFYVFFRPHLLHLLKLIHLTKMCYLSTHDLIAMILNSLIKLKYQLIRQINYSLSIRQVLPSGLQGILHINLLFIPVEEIYQTFFDVFGEHFFIIFNINSLRQLRNFKFKLNS